jgi:hypothetical protein
MPEQTSAAAVERRIARHLGAALSDLVQAERLTNDAVVAGSAEFLTRVCVMAFAAERAQGYGVPLAQLVARMEDLTGAIAVETMKRLRRRWTP